MNVFTVVILVAGLITAVAYIMTDDLADGRRKSSDETKRMGGIVGGDPAAVIQCRDRFCRRRGNPCRWAPREAVSDAVDRSVIVVAPGGGSRYASVSFLPNIC